MADVILLIGNDAEPGSRYQVFTQNEVNQGDVIRVKASLRGRPASKVSISNGGAELGVRFNVYHTIYALRSPTDHFNVYGQRNVSTGQEVIESGLSAQFIIDADGTLDLDNDFAVSDIMVTTATSDFKIIVS